MTTQDAVSGPQREPDERVREALDWSIDGTLGIFSAHETLAAEVRRLQAALAEHERWDSEHSMDVLVPLDEYERLQAALREPVAEVVRNEPGGKVSLRWFIYVADGTKLYTHPHEGLPEEHENGFLLDDLLDACTYGDSYGVAGSDFTVCRICNAESGAGRLRKPEAEWHDKDCEYLKFKTAFKAASPERLQERLRFVLGCSNVETRNDGLVELLNEYQSALAAALAASKGTPDLHPRPRETAAESLSVDTSVADRKDAARGRYLIRALHCDDFLNHFGCYTNSIATREKLVDAAMSADVRSQAKDTQGREATVSDDRDNTKSAARPEPTR